VLVRSGFGNAGVLSLAGVVGVVDVDPFILSLVRTPQGGVTLMRRGILIAMMSNTFVKGVYFAAQAPGPLRVGRPLALLALDSPALAFILLV